MEDNVIPFLILLCFVALVCFIFGSCFGYETLRSEIQDSLCKQTCITTDCYFKCKEQKFADVINGLRCMKKKEE